MSQLTAQQQAVVEKYGKFLKAGASYGEALRAAAKQATECSALLHALAGVHAKHYECNMSWDTVSHRATFHSGDKSTRETRNEAATISWRRNVLVHFKTDKDGAKAKAKAKTAKQKSQAEILFAKYLSMDKAEQRLFKKMLGA